ncbi:polyketide cyclase [Brachybacterium vulturis]|uniref:Polyketide cyclase n=1 Tax=Brachybacterium vulturis TaxID=2017484 RepID=A0A291GKM2_9MICO|nr:polyketide cyclase [Brachybacterium vulturis]ATG50747.1 polyketide cyclase [Brachybacterium vulturis]
MADGSVLPADSPVPDEIVRSALIHATAERVFAIIHEPGWFINDGEYREHKITRQGAITQVVDPVHGSFQLAIEAREPPNRIRFRWLGGGLGAISDAPNNTVEFIIDPAGTAKRNLVRLTVRERGFAKLGLDEAVRRRNFEENYRGWEQQLRVARELAEGGPRTSDEQ